MAERAKPIPKDLLQFERMALRIKLAAAIIYGRDEALAHGGTDEQFAARLGITVRQFRKSILDILKTDVDDLADMTTALDARLRIGTKFFGTKAAPPSQPSPHHLSAANPAASRPPLGAAGTLSPAPSHTGEG